MKKILFYAMREENVFVHVLLMHWNCTRQVTVKSYRGYVVKLLSVLAKAADPLYQKLWTTT